MRAVRIKKRQNGKIAVRTKNFTTKPTDERIYAMKEFTHVITDPNGMHARPAGRLATFAKQFTASVRVECNGKEADGKRLLSLMGLGAVCGTALHFMIEGEDEEKASEALLTFCRENRG